MLCANNTTVIKTDTSHHLIEFLVWEEGGGSIWVNSLQFSLKNTMMETHNVLWESYSKAIREDFLKEVTCHCDPKDSRS